MMDQDKILSFLKLMGPITPTAVAKNIKTDVLLASALLSDLSAQNKVKVSKLKIGGGSPLYFLPGQEDQLFKFADGNFNPKDYQVLLQLKERKLLREKELELLAKVALRTLKDFAIPLNVNIHGQTELFWKWHLLSNEEANKMIGDFISHQNPEVSAEEYPSEEKTLSKQEVKQEPVIEKKEEQEVKKPVPEVKSESKAEVVKEEQSNKVTSSSAEPTEPEVKKEPQIKEIPPETKPVVEKKEEPTKEVKKESIIEKKEEQKKLSVEEKKSFIQKVKDKVTKKRKTIDDEFFPQIEDFFNNLKITIDQKETLRKNAEMNFILKVPSVVGRITYFCKAKNKSKCDEKDISAAYMEAQAKRLPLLFLYTNEINKKSLELLEAGAFENVAVKKVE